MSYRNHFFKAALNYKGSVLANYRLQIERQNRLLNTIKSALPDRLSSHALSCVVSEKKVSLYTDSAIWSSQLRFYHQTMLQALHSSNQGHFESIQIKVMPKAIEIERKNDQLKIIPSTESIDNILDQAENQPDEELKNALLRLGNAFKKISSNKKKPSE
ncbi:MAG: DUF721 domain-containing protein [Methylococcales bacterium]|nr:DUF721 domain-containing protein [Methylococcales bacterium]